MSKLKFNVGTMNDTFISNDNSKMNVDKSENKTIIKNKIIHHTKLPKRMSEEDIEKLKKITMRPNLKDKLGKHIECFGYVVGNYRDMEDRYTVINLIDVEGNVYTADHVQLDFKQNEYDYTYDEGNFIRFKGIVKEYPKNGTVDYTVDISNKVKIMPSEFIVLNNIIDCDELETDYDKINDYLSRSNMTKIYNLLDDIRNKINEYLEGCVSDDFIYYYIINQYFLNQATYYIYEGNLRDQGFSGDTILQILIILANVLRDISSSSSQSLVDIMESVTQYCNVTQGVQTYNNCESNPGFKKFIETYIISKQKPGKKKLKQLWNIVECRMKNFNEKNANKFNLSRDRLTARAYPIINEFIEVKCKR
jgi:hypothetical protein